MKNLSRIKGIETLLEKLPEEYQHWYLFGHNILKFDFEKKFDYENKFCDIYCINMILADESEKYKISMQLYNVSGNISFDVYNGFFSGFIVEDKKESGYENEQSFVLTSFEPDIDFEIRCENISVKLLED